MASIEKYQGKYRVRWRVGGKQKAKTFRAHKDAIEYRNRIETELRAGSAVDPAQGRRTFRDWYSEWTTTRVDLKASTLATSRSLYRTHISRWDGYRLDSITQPMVQTWVAELSARSGKQAMKPATILAAYKDFASCMRGAVNARYIRDTPCVNIKLPKVERDEMTILDHGQIRAVADAINPRYKALVVLLAYSGLRIGEAAALRWSNVDLKAGTVRVTSTVSEVAGKGLVLGKPKTKASLRTVPLPQHALTALREHKLMHGGEWVFTSSTGAQLNPRAFNRRPFASALSKAGVRCRVHDLRHTAISLWIRAGVDLPRVKAWAGHTSSTFTVDRYGHFFPVDDAAILARLDANIAGAP